MKLVAMMLFAVCVAPVCRGEKVKWQGYVSDARCGAKVDAACAKKCAQAGAPLVFVTEQQKVIQVVNGNLLRGHEGLRVQVMGDLNDGKLNVTSVEDVKASH